MVYTTDQSLAVRSAAVMVAKMADLTIDTMADMMAEYLVERIDSMMVAHDGCN